MKEFTELLSITEHQHNVATAVISDTVIFENFEEGIERSKEERDSIVKSLFVLGRSHLTNELNEIRDIYLVESQRGFINISPEPEHENTIVTLSFLSDKEGNFSMLVFFGGKADKTTSIVDGLIHAIEVIISIESDY